jgi:hypothetical protein
MVQHKGEGTIESFTGFYYVSGQNGTPLFASDFSMVSKAKAVSIEGYTANQRAIVAQVTGFSYGSGTLYAGSTYGTVPPVANEVVVQLLQYGATGTLTEIASGTITQNVNIYIEGV